MAEAKPKTTSRPLKWLKRASFCGLGLVALLALFHRPLLRSGLRYFGPKLLAREGLTLTWQVEGTVTQGLQLNQVELQGPAAHWLGSVKLAELSANYDVWKLWQSGPADFLEGVKLHDAFAEVDLGKLPTTAEPANTEPKPQSSPQAIVWPRFVDLKNVNATVRAADGSAWELHGLTFQAGEGQPGKFLLGSLRQLPHGLQLTNLAAEVDILDRRLVITNLQGWEDVVVEKMSVDLQSLGKDELPVAVALSSGEAHFSLEGLLRGLSGELAADAQGELRLPELSKLPALQKLVPALACQSATVTFQAKGPILQPAGLQAQLNLNAQAPTWETYGLDAVSLGVDLRSGSLKADAKLAAKENSVTIRATSPWQKCSKWSEVSAAAYRADVTAALADLATLPLNLDLTGEGKLNAEATYQAPSYEAKATLEAANLGYAGYHLPKLNAAASAKPEGIAIEQLEASLGGTNTLTATGTLRETWQTAWRLKLPELGTAWQTVGLPGPVVDGKLELTGTTAGADVTAELRGREFRYEGHEVAQLEVNAAYAKDSVNVNHGALKVDEANTLQFSGRADLSGAKAVQAKVEAEFTRLSKLLPWLSLAKVEVPLREGELRLKVDAVGSLERQDWTGGGEWNVAKLAVDGLPEAVSTAGLFTANHGKLLLQRCEAACGSLAALQTTGWISPENMDLVVQAKSVELAPWAQQQASGLADAVVKLTGATQQPTVNFELAVKNLRSPKMPPKAAPAALQLTGSLQQSLLDAQGSVTQPPLQPLSFVAKTGLQPESPLQASVQLPSSDLAFLSQWIPALASLNGQASLTADISGKLAAPRCQGALQLNLPQIAFSSASIPSVREVNLDLRVDGTKLTPTLRALLAGGSVALDGTVELANPAAPVFALDFAAREALVVRDRDTSLRADADLSVDGSLQALAITGRVEAVRGRVFKEVEFLPLSLPSDLPPLPPATEKSEPMRLPAFLGTTKFDVGLKTKDPLRLLGNVLNGAVVADMRLQGTGAAPVLSGKASFNDAILALPFSKMKIVKGEAVVDPAKPLEPQLNIRGESHVGEYDVTLYVSGSAFAPKLQFFSVPPLAEPDIAVLLATGAPLASSAEQAGAEAAGQTAFLILQKMYRKMLGKSTPRYEEPAKLRMSFAASSGLLGQDGPAVIADYDFAKQYRVRGSAAQSGNMRAMLTWLVRFGEPLTKKP
jgi:autotransporter translocation and assembly factor TamB